MTESARRSQFVHLFHPPISHQRHIFLKVWCDTSKSIQALKAFVSFTWLQQDSDKAKAPTAIWLSISQQLAMYTSEPPNLNWVTVHIKNQVILPGTGASRAEVQTYTASTRAQDLKNLSKCLWASDHFMSAIYTALQMAQDVNAWFWQYWDLCWAETSPKRKPHVPHAFPGTWQRAGNPQCHSTRHLFKS